MDSYATHARNKLKAAGYKLTDSRKILIDFLEKNYKALSPYDMKDGLQKNHVHLDVVTIYRILEVMEKLNLVHKVLSCNGYVRCNTDGDDTQERCHHYLYCTSCKKVEEIEGEDLGSLEKKIEKNNEFSITSHHLEFVGICKSCKKK